MGRSRPRWGWHQLDPGFARQLIGEAELPNHALVVDIGAGTGAITRQLVHRGHRVIAVERHRGRAAELEARLGRAVTVVRADAADLRLPRRPFHVVANPPHSIITAIMRRLLHPGSRLLSAHLVVPVWAVRRWTASNAPGAQRWSGAFDLAPGRFVPRQRFVPPPRADARVLVIRRR